MQVELKALTDHSRARIGLRECSGPWGATVARMDASGQPEGSSPNDTLGAPKKDWRQEETQGKRPSLRQDWQRGAAAPPPREQKPYSARARRVNCSPQSTGEDHCRRERKEKKKTFPPEIGVLNFLDWDSKAPPTTGAAAGGER